jgi:hypothetical protein
VRDVLDRTSITGHILEVHHEWLGATVAAAAAIGQGYIDVDDVTDFDEDGGLLEAIDTLTETAVVYSYTAIDEDLNRITLSGTLTTALSVNDTIRVYPHAREKIAVIDVDDVESEEPLHAVIRHGLRPLIPTGTRQGRYVDAESVSASVVDDVWQVMELNGQEPLISEVELSNVGVPTDGSAPASSPVPMVTGGVGFLAIRWTPVVNADPVTYEAHVSTTTGFTPGPTTKVGETLGTILFARVLPDGSALLNGTTYYVQIVAKDADGSAAPSTEASGALAQVTGPDLAVGAIIAGSGVIADAAIGNALIQDLSADKITGGTIDAQLVISGEIRTAETGRRAIINTAGIQLIEADDTLVVSLPTDSGQPAYFAGQVVALGFVATGNAAFRGTGNVLDTGSVTKLQGGGMSDPTTPPTVAVNWETLVLGTQTGSRYGMAYDANGDSGGATPSFWVADQTTLKAYEYKASDGSLLRSIANDDGLGHTRWNGLYGVCRAGADVYVLAASSGGIPVVFRFRQSDLAFQSTSIPSLPSGATGWGGLFYDGTYLCLPYRTSGNKAEIRRFNLGSSQSTVDTISTSGTGNPTLSSSTQLTGGVKLTEDASTKYWLAVTDDASIAKVYAWSTAGVFQSGFDFEAAAVPLRGLSHDGTQFWSLQESKKATKHTSWRWTSGSDTRWVRYAWYDGTNETLPSPAASIAAKKRGRIKVTLPAFASSQARVYSYNNATDAAAPYTSYKRVASIAASPTYISADPTTNSPATTNGFSGGTPAEVQYGNGRMTGDGRHRHHKTTSAGRPAGEQGEVVYNTDTKRLEQFDTAWKPMQGYAGALATKSANQAISSGGAFTQATLSGTDHDTHAYFDNANDRFTVPTGMGGMYEVHGQVDFAASNVANVAVRARIRKNGTTIMADKSLASINDTNRDTIFDIDAVVQLSDGDYVELIVAQNSGVSRDLVGDGSAGGSTNLGLVYLGSK